MTKSNLKFAFVTASRTTGEYVAVPHAGDDWDMYAWLSLFEKSYHYGFDDLGENYQELDKYDLVFISGHHYYYKNIIYLAGKTKAVTVWFPEGDITIYHERLFGGIYSLAFEAWNACSIFGIVEEDKIPFWSVLVNKPIKFLHVPVPEKLINGLYFSESKNNDILVYGDNNPNNPLVACIVAIRLGKSVAVTAWSDVDIIKSYCDLQVNRLCGKVSQGVYLSDWMAKSKVAIYPTSWVGTARQVISGAVCGTPVVGNRDSHTQRRLFPKLGTYIYDIDKMCELVSRLYDDSKFYEEIVEYAREEVKFYSASNALNRLLQAYEEVKK